MKASANNGPTLSVLMAAYHVERFIDEAIQSVLRQKGVSFELLIGDDASTDGTWVRIQKYQADPRVRAWSFRRHRGAGAIWNFLISRARGDCVAVCDADDVMLPGCLRAGSGILDRRKEVGLVYASHWVEGPNGEGRLHAAALPQGRWDLIGIPVWNPGTFIRTELIKRVGGYRRSLPFMLDYDLFLRLAEVTRFHPLPGGPRYVYRRRTGSMSDRRREDQNRVIQRIRREAILRRYGYRVPW